MVASDRGAAKRPSVNHGAALEPRRGLLGSEGLFLALQQHQVREHPFTENALGPSFDIRLLYPPAQPICMVWFGFQLEQGQHKPFPLACGQGLDLLKQFNSAHSKTLMALVECNKSLLRGPAENL